MPVANLPDWLGQLLFGIRHAKQAEVAANDSDTLNFLAPLTAVWNSSTGHIDIGVGGSGAAPTFTTVTASSVVVGPETWTSGPIVQTTDGSIVNLLAAPLAIPASGALRLRVTAEAKILSYASTWTATWTYFVKWARNGTGAPFLVSVTPDQYESGVNGAPFALINGPSHTLSVVGANSDSGAIRLTVAGSSVLFGNLSGASGTVANVGGVSAATGTWALSWDDSTHVTLRGSTWGASSFTNGGTIVLGGSVGAGIASGNAAQIQAAGILPPPWISGEAVPFGAVRYDSVGGNTYIYTLPGGGTTSSRPTGTTTGSDAGLTYEFLFAGQVCPVSWRVTGLRYAAT